MVPPHQGLHTHDPPRPQRHLGLVVHDQLPPLDGVVQAALELQPLVGLGVEARRVELVGVATAVLGPVHGGVGVLEQRLGGGAVLRVQGHAHAGRDVDLLASQGEGAAERPQHLACHPDDVVLAVDLAEEDRELVAAHAGDGVVFAHRLGEAPAHQLQELVADSVPQAVVDLLEPVEVDEHHRHRALALVGGGQRDRHLVDEQVPSGQAGEVVVASLQLELGPLPDHPHQ